MIRREVDDIVRSPTTKIAAAMRAIFGDTHNVAEGAGAAALAALLGDRDSTSRRPGRRRADRR